jgi:hypothetical protein
VPAFLLAGIGWSGSTIIAVLGWIATVMGIATYYLAGVRYLRVARAIRKARAG